MFPFLDWQIWELKENFIQFEGSEIPSPIWILQIIVLFLWNEEIVGSLIVCYILVVRLIVNN